jgi:serine/threonine-protein kinase
MPGITDSIGRVLGDRYRLLTALGTGASAHVYLAEDISLHRQVAIKVLHPALAGDSAFLKRFRAEARAAAALNHPNIMQVFDWGEQENEPYLVLEFLSGGSLRQIFDTGLLLTPEQAVRIGVEAAAGLDFAHRRGLVHRDIKPANLLLGGEHRLRIADFGLARALAEAAWTEPAGAVLGTARYAAPEQVEGKPLDGRADVYALTLVLYEGVTGDVPFSSDTTIATLMGRVNTPLPPHERLGPLNQVLALAGAPDPGERYTAAEMAARLQELGTTLPPPVPLPIAQEIPRRGSLGRRVAGAAGLGGAAGAAGLGSAAGAAGAAGDAGAAGAAGVAGAASAAGAAGRGDTLGDAGPGVGSGAGAAGHGGPPVTGDPDVDPGPGGTGDADIAGGPSVARPGLASDPVTARLPASMAGSQEPTVHPWTGSMPGPSGPHAPTLPVIGDDPDRTDLGIPATALEALGRATSATRGVFDFEDGAPGGTTKSKRSRRAGGANRMPKPPKARRPPTLRRRRWPWVVGIVVVVLALLGAGAAWAVHEKVFTPSHAIPSLTGKTVAEARAAVAANHFTVQESGHHSDITVPAGRIISQNPASAPAHGPPVMAKEGLDIKVVVSDGPPPVNFPNLTTFSSCGDAIKALQALHLVGVCPPANQQYSDSAPPGAILGSTPSGTAPYGSTVVISTSKGHQPVAIPDVSGQTYSAAAGALQAAGFVATQQQSYNSSVASGSVIGTDPDPSAGPQPYGSTVTVNVSLGPQPVPVPSGLNGQTVAKATAALQAAGLTVGSVFGPATGKVFDTDPAAGAQVQPGAPVNLYTK